MSLSKNDEVVSYLLFFDREWLRIHHITHEFVMIMHHKSYMYDDDDYSENFINLFPRDKLANAKRI